MARPAQLTALGLALVAAVGCGRAGSEGNGPEAAGPLVDSSTGDNPCGDGELPSRRAAVLAVDPDGSVRWTAELPVSDDLDAQASPVVDGERVYTAEADELRAFDLRSGDEQWRREVGGPVFGTWLVAGTLVAVVDQVSAEATVLGVDPEDGTVRWRHAPEGNGLVGEQHRTGDGALAMVDDAGTLVVLDARHGRVRWRAPGTRTPWITMTAGEVLRADAGVVASYDTASGARRWQLPLETSELSDEVRPHVVDGVVVAGSIGSPDVRPLVAYDLADRRERWRLAPDGNDSEWILYPSTGALLHVQQVYGRSALRVIEAATGELRWRASLGDDRYLSTPPDPLTTARSLWAVEQGRGGRGGRGQGSAYLVARNLDDGVITASVDLGDAAVRSVTPRPADGVLVSVLGGRKGDRLVAVEGERVVWEVELPQAPAEAPAVAPDGTVVIAVRDPQRACPAADIPG